MLSRAISTTYDMWFDVDGPVKIRSSQWILEGYWPVGQCQKILMSQPGIEC